MPVTAIPPTTALVSVSVMVVVPEPLLMKVPVRLIVLAAVGTVVPSEGLAAVSTGAVFGLVTVSEAVSVAVLKAVVPPLVVVSAVPPRVPVVASQAQ